MRLMKALFLIFLFAGSLPLSAAIPTSERDALIAFYDSTQGDSWVDRTRWKGDVGTECTWSGITCNATETNVTEIWLPYNNLSGVIPASIGSLTQLEVLYLPYNSISGIIQPAILTLSRLRVLALASNQLTGTIPSDINRLANLTNLELSGNLISGPIPVSIGQLSKLEQIILYDNELSGSIPDSIAQLPQLEYLSLASNDLTGAVPATLGNLTNLRWFYLGDNRLSGAIPASLGQLANLEQLQLAGNRFSGSIPPQLGNLTRLRLLDLSSNLLTGPIPTEIGNLTALEELYLAINQLDGTIPSSLSRLGSLYSLNFSFNRLSGSLPPELGQLSSMRYLHIGANQLTGTIPAQIGSLSKLEELSFESNQLTGTIPAEFAQLKELRLLVLSDNNLTGPVPDLGTLTNLRQLSLGHNPLGGTIPSWIGRLTALQYFTMESAQLTGGLPVEMRELTNLVDLILYENELSGTIPTWIDSFTNLETVLLGGNRFTGNIPAEVTRLANLTYFDVNGNFLTGSIPANIGDLRQLQYLTLSSNALTGSIPPSLGTIPTLVDVRLEYNEFTGPLPSFAAAQSLEVLLVGVNNLTGTFPVELTTLPNLLVLSLSSNRFTGPLPPQIGNMTKLEYFDFSENAFVGKIPSEITRMVSLVDGSSALNYNGLYTDDAAVLAFVNQKLYQFADWRETQTIPPTNLTVSQLTDRSAVVSWKAIDYSYDSGGYRVMASTTPNGTPVAITTTNEKWNESTIVRGLSPSTAYYFRIVTVTHPHDFQHNLIVSDPSSTVSGTTGPRVLSPAEVALTKQPTGLIQVGQTAQNTDSFILTNFGDVATDVTIHKDGSAWFTVAPTAFNLGPGASQTVTISLGTPQPPGGYWGGVGIQGVGVPADYGVGTELLSVAVPNGTVVGEALTSRVDLAGDAETSSVGVATFRNAGTADLTGVLVSDASWIVTPLAVINIPPNESRQINFTVDRSKREGDVRLGALTGTISLVYVDGAVSGKLLTEINPHDGLPPGVSVSIVTVVDTAKPSVTSGGIPALSGNEVARFIPGLKSLKSVGASVVSDVNVTNAFGASSLDDVRMYFSAAGSASGASVSTVPKVDPSQSVSFSNVVSSVYGASNGSLQLRGSQWQSLTLSGVLHQITSNVSVGTAMPSFRSDRAAGAGVAQYLVGVNLTANVSGDILIQEASGQATSARVDFLNATGGAVGTPVTSIALSPFAFVELKNAVPAGATTAIVTNVGGPGRIVALAMMNNSSTGDVWPVVDWSRYFDNTAAASFRVPVASSQRGGGRKRPVRGSSTTLAATATPTVSTEVSLFNPSATDDAFVQVSLLDRGGSSTMRELRLSPRQTTSYSDIVSQLFSRSGRFDGQLTVAAVKGQVMPTSRIRQDAASGSNGSAVPALPSAAGLRLGESQFFAGIEDAHPTTISSAKAGTYKTSLILSETSGGSLKVRASVLFADGRSVVAANVAKTFDLAANQTLFLDSVSLGIVPNRATGYGDLHNVQLQLQVIEGSGSLLPVLITTESASGDTFVRIE